MLRNKKAAIGATMTWVVATIIILVVVIFFIYASYVVAGERKAKLDSATIQVGEYSSNINYEQMLLSLLKTELDGQPVKEYILDGNYDELEQKIQPILDKLPDPRFEGWHLYIYENEEPVKKIGGDFSILEVIEASPAMVYLDLNKKVRLF